MKPTSLFPVLLMTGFLSTLGLSLSSSPALASLRFGYDGRDGRDGSDGFSGAQGPSYSIVASGAPQVLDLSAPHGERGWDGENGQDASGCFFVQSAQNRIGANGGNAGRGGRGGHGGNTGLLTVTYDRPEWLSLIQIRAIPGQGGPGGRPGYPGRGCRCPYMSWTITQNGTTETFFCQNGRDGSSAYASGAPGMSGLQQPTLLIPQTAPLPTQTPQRTIRFEDLLSGPFELSKHQWATVSGVRALFAPGSVMSDLGAKYMGLLQLQYAFEWTAAKPLSEFAGQSAVLTLTQAKIELRLPQDLWIDGEEVSAGTLTKFRITSALQEKDAANLSLGSPSGSGTALSIPVVDASGVSDLMTTAVEIRYSTMAGAFGYQVRYSGVVPASALGITPQQISVAVGQLGILSTYLRPGTPAKVDLSVTRKLGNRSKTVTMSKTFRI